MGNKILAITVFLVCSIIAAFAQADTSTQLDPASGSDQAALTPKDVKLIATPPVPSDQLRQFQQSIQDIHFDFDRADLRPEDRDILARDAEWIKAHPGVLITLEGDADERGDIIYNLVLSGERAQVTKDALVEMGVPSDRIPFAIGWGKLYPVCEQADEGCWSQNRRTHFDTWPPAPEPSRVASR